jgi:hypothetical protein
VSEYLRFEKVGDSKSGTTEIWNVIATRSGFALGQVRWFARWRQYVFFPTVFRQAAFNPTCMYEIAEFSASLTSTHRTANLESEAQ